MKYLLATPLALLAFPLLAQDAELVPGVNPAVDTSYIFNTLLFLISGFLVMFMAAGFSMLEVGFVRSKNASTQLLKNIMLYSIACVMFWLVGYNLMYPGDGWTISGILGAFHVASLEPVGATAEQVDVTYASVGSDFFFQLVFCATTASIVSGTLAERIKINPFFIFIIILTGIIYPIVGSWGPWGGGFIAEKFGFSDFAGSTIVHSVGGWAALAGALVLGPRLGRYVGGKVVPFPGSNMPMAALGTFILWLGWFGFNGGSQLAAGTIGDVTDVSRIFVNTNAAAAAGAIVAYIMTLVLYKKPDLTMVLNGALVGLVSITAEPLAPSLWLASFVGGVGAVLAVLAVPMLDKFKIDDVVGAIPVHLVGGIWGTLAVAFSGTNGFIGQLMGIVIIGAFVFIVSYILWTILAKTIGIRVSEEEEINGLDQGEVGVLAYPEFTTR